MQGILTYNKLVNLFISRYIFFDLINLDISYCKEKYYRIFNTLADKPQIINGKINIYEYITEQDVNRFYSFLDRYKTKWKYSDISETDLLMLFSINRSIHIDNLSPSLMIKKHKQLYTSFDSVSDVDQRTMLHDTHKGALKRWEDKRNDIILTLKRRDKLLKINKTINKEWKYQQDYL